MTFLPIVVYLGMIGFRFAPKPYETTPDVVKGLDPSEWICNVKYDGWRMWSHQVGRDNFECLTASGTPMEQRPGAKFDTQITEQFRALELPPDTVLDAEFVGPRGNHSPTAYIFDMLAWNGEWITDRPYEERWDRCCELALPSDGIIHRAETVETGFLTLFNRLKDDWIATGKGMHLTEGIVIKSRQGIAQLDRRRRAKGDWLMKLKYRENTSTRY